MYCPMAVEQLQMLFLTLSLGGCSLLSLDVSYSNLSSLEPGLLAEAVNKLQTVVLTSTHLTGEQVHDQTSWSDLFVFTDKDVFVIN